jgi:hypothetical protein
VRELVECVAVDLNEGRPVALGFEGPLFVPLAEDPADLTAGRKCEGDRPWSAGAGCGSLATGLTQTLWILERTRRALRQPVQVFLDGTEFQRAGSGLFVWEAFVTKAAKQSTHCGDAEVAVDGFRSCLPEIDSHNAIPCSRVRSLIGAALLQAGWSDDLRLLEKPCVVIRVPVSAGCAGQSSSP